MKNFIVLLYLTGIGMGAYWDKNEYFLTLTGSGDCGVNEEINSTTMECVCQPGYFNVSGTCVQAICDIGVCFNSATCEQGSVWNNYTCLCADGYSGQNCSNFEICRTNVCQGRGTCFQGVLWNDYNCTCFEGYSGDNCTFQEICRTNVCKGRGTCYQGEIWNDYNCTCFEGYSGDNCTFQDICQTPVCGPNGECKQGNEWDNYTCNCHDGYIEPNCIEFDPCSMDPPCNDRGNCTNENNSSQCVCEGYVGEACTSEDTGECAFEPCNSEQDCQNGEEGYRCTCKKGYVGEDCSQKDPCLTETCNSHGTCRSFLDEDFGAYIALCECSAGWGGSKCSLENYCSTPDACNGRKCEQGDKADSYTCTCDAESGGYTCDIPFCPENGNFSQALVGETKNSNSLCEGGEFAGKPRGANECVLEGSQSKWAGPVWIDCTSGLDSIENPAEKLRVVAVITSDPDNIQEEDIDVAVKALNNLPADEEISAESADSAVACVNNLLSAESTSVQEQSATILESLDKVAKTVKLSTSSNLQFYSTINRKLGLTAVGDLPAGTQFNQPKSTNCWSYSIDKSLVREDELAGVDPRYSKNCSAPEAEAASNFIIVRNTNSPGASFTVFSDDLLFQETNPETHGFINSLILSSNTSGNNELWFQLFEFYELNLTTGHFENGSNSMNASCVQWKDSARWSSSGCALQEVKFLTRNYFARCSCNDTKGSFTVKMVTDQVETSEPSGGSGLSGGEIAGIVVGSVAGVALIAGGSYYGYSSKKKDSVENLTSSNKVNPATPEAQDVEARGAEGNVDEDGNSGAE